MIRLNTASVSLAVTPTVVSTLLSHYLNRKPLRQRPTAHLSYDEGLHLIRSFLAFASHHTVEELQAFTGQWVPHPQWVRLDEVTITEASLIEAARLLEAQLGPDGIRRVGGRLWWQWRKPKSPLKAEWIEMRADYHERKAKNEACTRVMLYVHGGAYFFGSVDEHRYQMQRHARKLKARVLAPRYRLAPQFPFPCGLLDCLAAYLYLLTVHEPKHIVLAGDSAGGGMVVALMCLLRDQNVPLPAGAVLISPWVDLSHSFPSVAGDNPLDYIPPSGFHHKPSRAWPPPNDDEIRAMREEVARSKETKSKSVAGVAENAKNGTTPGTEQGVTTAYDGALVEDISTYLSVSIDGEQTTIKDQIQMYTTNELLSHPLVSPVLQPTLGGLPPLLIMVGGGELLRDEQIYLAHKCANPAEYAAPDADLSELARAQLKQYPPTDVQLQVWDDLCHVAPTLSFTRPAKYMYRSIAQFGAWALARAQKTGIDILDDDAISVISESGSDSGENDPTAAAATTMTTTPRDKPPHAAKSEAGPAAAQAQIGKAGDPLPPFKDHMIRQRVTRHGAVYPLAEPSELPGCCVKHRDVGTIKEGTVRKWLATRKLWDERYAAQKKKVREKILRDLKDGYLDFGDGERPPPSALAGRRKVASELVEPKKKRSMGLALWSLWGSKHDEMTVVREARAEGEAERTVASEAEGRGARPYGEIEKQDAAGGQTAGGGGGGGGIKEGTSRSRSRRRTVVDEQQTGAGGGVDEDTPVMELIKRRKEREAEHGGLLSPDYVPDTGVAGRRPMLDGIAMPFSLGREAETASMLTLQSEAERSLGSRAVSPTGPRMLGEDSGIGFPAGEAPSDVAKTGHLSEREKAGALPDEKPVGLSDVKTAEKEKKEGEDVKTERPVLETFVTAAEELPRVG